MKKYFLFSFFSLLAMVLTTFVSAQPAGTASEKFVVNTQKSKLEWSGSAKDHSHSGTIAIKSGFVTALKGKLNGGEFVLDMASVKSNSNSEKLDGHLKTGDFLDVAKYPEATLLIQSATYTTDTKAEITGVLTFKGNKIPVKFPAYVRTINPEKGVFAEAFFELDRTSLGINFPGDTDIHFSVKITAK